MSPVLIALAGWIGGNVVFAGLCLAWYLRECRRGTPERWWPV